jgi:hypothetical protein
VATQYGGCLQKNIGTRCGESSTGDLHKFLEKGDLEKGGDWDRGSEFEAKAAAYECGLAKRCLRYIQSAVPQTRSGCKATEAPGYPSSVKHASLEEDAGTESASEKKAREKKEKKAQKKQEGLAKEKEREKKEPEAKLRHEDVEEEEEQAGEVGGKQKKRSLGDLGGGGSVTGGKRLKPFVSVSISTVWARRLQSTGKGWRMLSHLLLTHREEKITKD